MQFIFLVPNIFILTLILTIYSRLDWKDKSFIDPDLSLTSFYFSKSLWSSSHGVVAFSFPSNSLVPSSTFWISWLDFSLPHSIIMMDDGAFPHVFPVFCLLHSPWTSLAFLSPVTSPISTPSSICCLRRITVPAMAAQKARFPRDNMYLVLKLSLFHL